MLAGPQGEGCAAVDAIAAVREPRLTNSRTRAERVPPDAAPRERAGWKDEVRSPFPAFSRCDAVNYVLADRLRQPWARDVRPGAAIWCVTYAVPAVWGLRS